MAKLIRKLFGYPINITNLQENDILVFNGEEWINVDINDEKVYLGYTSPDTEQNQDKSVFTMDGIPVQSNLYMRKEVPLSLFLEATSISYNDVDIDRVKRLTTKPCGSLRSGTHPMPQSTFLIHNEPNPVRKVCMLPSLEIIVI